jgi:hypothetical protein
VLRCGECWPRHRAHPIDERRAPRHAASRVGPPTDGLNSSSIFQEKGGVSHLVTTRQVHHHLGSIHPLGILARRRRDISAHVGRTRAVGTVRDSGLQRRQAVGRSTYYGGRSIVKEILNHVRFVGLHAEFMARDVPGVCGISLRRGSSTAAVQGLWTIDWGTVICTYMVRLLPNKARMWSFFLK